jgi:hypothetical protein
MIQGDDALCKEEYGDSRWRAWRSNNFVVDLAQSGYGNFVTSHGSTISNIERVEDAP